MKFNSIGGTSDYSRAGKAAADDSIRAFAAARRNSPNYGKMVQDAAKIRSKEKMAMTKIQTEVAKKGIEANAGVKSTKLQIEGEEAARKGKRKAGVLGAAGKFFATAGASAGEKRTKREVGSSDAFYDKAIQDSENRTNTFIEQLNSGNTGDDGGNSANPKADDGSDSDSSTDTPKPVEQGKPVESGGTPGVLSRQAITDYAVQAGFTPEQARTVVGIAGGESGFDSSNSTERSGLKGKTGEDSVGLMQINWGYHKDSGWLQELGITKREDLFDPAKNMRAAKYLFDGRGNFGDWTVYNEGIYKDYL